MESATDSKAMGLADVPGSHLLAGITRLAYLPSVEKVYSFVYRPDVRMKTNTVTSSMVLM